MKIKSYKELIVWQRSIELVEEVYKIINKLPKTEEYALSPQMRRAAIAIPSNIAEGYRRNGIKEFIQFLYIALGSSAELETQLLISAKIYPMINYQNANSYLEETMKMLSVMISKLKAKRSSLNAKKLPEANENKH